MPSGSGPTSPTPPGGLTERRLSNSSDGSFKDGFSTRTISTDDYLGGMRGRVTKATPPKPAANPMQFVKVRPCNLYQTAQEQLRRSEEVKKVKEVVKEDAEEWQSNLDNWKSSRRKRVEHIIERVVEVKKLELEEHDRNRRRSKTFSEMMEERGSSRRKLSLAMYTEDDSNDLSDLGIGTSSASGKSSLSEDYDNQSVISDGQDVDNISNHENGNRDSGSSPGYDTSSTAPTSSPDPGEYTYEGAINDYKSRVSRTNSSNILNGKYSTTKMNNDRNDIRSELENGNSSYKKRHSVNKIEERLINFEQNKLGGSNNDLSVDSVKKQIPKVDILKRRELFENEKSPERIEPVPKVTNRLSGDFTQSKSIKERLSNLEKYTEEPSNKMRNANNRLSGDISTIRERMSNLERQTSEEKKEWSPKQIPPASSVKERLTILQNQARDEPKQTTITPVDLSLTIKDRLSHLDSACRKEPSRLTPESDPEFHGKLSAFRDVDSTEKQSVRSLSPEEDIYGNKRQFHQSLDSLDVEERSSDLLGRSQSLEDLDGSAVGSGDYCGDTDREDSGIHTADVSCSVSQADEQAEVEDTIVANITSFSEMEPYVEQPLKAEFETVNFESEIVELSECPTEACDIPSSPILSVTPLPDLESIEEITICSPEPDNDTSVMEALDIAFQAIDTSIGNDPQVRTDVDKGAANSVREIKNINELNTLNESQQLNLENSKLSEPVITHTPSSVVEIGNYTESVIIKEDMSNTKSAPTLPVYENITLFSNGSGIPTLTLGSDLEIVSSLQFPLGSGSRIEPPKGKPPPPPVDDLTDEEEPVKDAFTRLNSTKRIKKELRNKRTSFLGIEGDEHDVESEFTIVPPPNMVALLQEERRIQQQLYRQSISYDSDSIHGENTESRDSGVELERGQSDDTWSNQQASSSDTLSEQHSRQSSEPFTTSVTSEEDEISKKEREIIEILEKEEQWRYGGGGHPADGEKLASKLRQLEREKLELEHERSAEERRAREEEEIRMRSLEDQIREQQNKQIRIKDDSFDEEQSEEVLRVERELLQLEQEELKRQRENLIFRENQARRNQGANIMNVNTLSLQDISTPYINVSPKYSYCTPVQAQVDYRKSMPDLQQEPMSPTSGYKRPPIPPAKPLRILSQEQQERESNIRNSRMPSADSIPHQIEGVHLRHGSVPAQIGNSPTSPTGHQMTRNTLHALSATPRSRHIETWIQKRKSEPPRDGFNYNQHWLIQEAEQRRIDQQRGLNGQNWKHTRPDKHLPDSVIQTLTQRVQNRASLTADKNRRRFEACPIQSPVNSHTALSPESQEKMLSVSGKKKCSHCGDELGRGAAMIIESLRLFYHIDCFKCCVCRVQLGDGLMGTDVRVRNHKLHCHNCYSSDDGVKFSCV